jgi:hypothetical protein
VNVAAQEAPAQVPAPAVTVNSLKTKVTKPVVSGTVSNATEREDCGEWQDLHGGGERQHLVGDLDNGAGGRARTT